MVWAVTGPVFGFNDTWQLVISTGTTIVTFLMVFLIQSTQNRDSQAVQLKLDELLRASMGAHNALLDLEELEQDDLDRFRDRYRELAREARDSFGDDTGSPAVATGWRSGHALSDPRRTLVRCGRYEQMPRTAVCRICMPRRRFSIETRSSLPWARPCSSGPSSHGTKP